MLDFVAMVPGLLSTIGIGAICTIYKKESNRIDNLEQRTALHLSDAQVRLLLSDKLDPIKEDLSEIKTQLYKLFEFHPKVN